MVLVKNTVSVLYPQPLTDIAPWLKCQTILYFRIFLVNSLQWVKGVVQLINGNLFPKDYKYMYM